MRRSFLFALTTGVMGGVAGVLAPSVIFLACSSSSPSNTPVEASVVDAGHDASFGPPTYFDATPLDAVDATLHEAGHDAGADHALEAAIPDAMVIDVGKLAACSPLVGHCDLVSQNCSRGSECVVVFLDDGGATTHCQLTTAGEHLPQGSACCPPADDSNPCEPGLQCIGGNECVDAGSPGAGLPPGWQGSRCSPTCCPDDGGTNTANCGTAGDGGAQGYCNLGITVTENGDAAYSICTYPETCEPLGVHPCAGGFGCEVTANSTSCTVISNPNGPASGATEGQACAFANACANGYVCVGTGNSDFKCTWMCRLGDAAVPFDAAILDAAPGHGGCPDAQTCAALTGFPAWLGDCQ